MDEDKNSVDANDEAELDKELNASIESIRTENKVQVQPDPEAGKEGEVKAPEVPAEPTSPAPAEAEPTTDDPQKALEEGFKTPTKGKFESEESYQKRLDLSEKVKQRKLAKTEEERQKLSGEITKVRRELSTIEKSDKINNPPNKGGDSTETPNPGEEGDSKGIPVTREELDATLAKVEFDNSVKSTLSAFVTRHPELADEDTREVFFDFVGANYAWQDKTGKDLTTVLELARENMFKPSETISERVLKSANVAEKVNAMSFPGGTIVKPSLTPSQQKSVDELVATGMSADKALELISE